MVSFILLGIDSCWACCEPIGIARGSQASMRAAVDKAASELQAVLQQQAASESQTALPGQGVICICGSLHVVAEALAVLDLQESQ